MIFSALLGDLARRVPKQIDALWEGFENKDLILWATEKTKESSLYRFDSEMVENALRNETSSMVAFPVYVLSQELELFGPREDGYINLYRAIRDLPGTVNDILIVTQLLNRFLSDEKPVLVFKIFVNQN